MAGFNSIAAEISLFALQTKLTPELQKTLCRAYCIAIKPSAARI
jgi:hypothetical protein